MSQLFGNSTPPADAKYSVYEMETVSANAKKERDKAENVWISDEEAEATYVDFVKKERKKRIKLIFGISVLAIVILVSAYITIFCN